MKRLNYSLFGIIAAGLMMVANIGPTCWIGFYQPEQPESLRK